MITGLCLHRTPLSGILSLLAIATCATWSLGQENNSAAKDTPYTATVSDTEARFVFPIPVCDGWEFGGPAKEETDLRSFVTWFVPSHGPAWGDVSLLNAEGKQLWDASAPGEPAVISTTGDKVAALVYSTQEMT